MPQIGFTDKQAEVYHRFNALRRAYEDANGGGRIYNPDFLTVLMDAWEHREAVEYNSIIQAYIDLPASTEPVSLRAYIADAEVNDPELSKEQPKRKSLQDHIRERRERLNNPENETR